MTNIINIVIPLKKSRWGEEIKYCLRSWENYFDYPNYKIWILGNYRADWMTNIEYIYFNDNLKTPEQTHGEKLAWAMNRFGNFIYTNDDIYLLKAICPITISRVYCLGDLATVKNRKKNRWGKLLWDTADVLLQHNKTIYNGETHTPYWYNSNSIKKIFEEYKIGSGEGLLRTAYINNFIRPEKIFNIGHHKAGYYSKNDTNFICINRAIFLNHDDNGLSQNLKTKIIETFVSKSRFEKQTKIFIDY